MHCIVADNIIATLAMVTSIIVTVIFKAACIVLDTTSITFPKTNSTIATVISAIKTKSWMVVDDITATLAIITTIIAIIIETIMTAANIVAEMRGVVMMLLAKSR